MATLNVPAATGLASAVVNAGHEISMVPDAALPSARYTVSLTVVIAGGKHSPLAPSAPPISPPPPALASSLDATYCLLLVQNSGLLVDTPTHTDSSDLPAILQTIDLGPASSPFSDSRTNSLSFLLEKLLGQILLDTSTSLRNCSADPTSSLPSRRAYLCSRQPYSRSDLAPKTLAHYSNKLQENPRPDAATQSVQPRP